MPEYSFICKDCNNHFSLILSYSQYDNGKFTCNKCSSIYVHRDYSNDLNNIFGSVKKSDNELKTIGDLANRNRDRLSNDKKEELEKKHNAYKEELPGKDLPKGMSRMKKHKKKIKWT